MRNLKITMLLLALVGLLAFAGCGGDSDDSSSDSTAAESTATDSTATDATTDSAGSDYATELSGVLTEFGTAFSTLGTELQGVKDEDALKTGIADLESQIQTTISDLEALDAPPEAQEGQDQIVAAFQAFSDKLTEVGDAVDSGDASAAATAAQELQAAGATFQKDFGAGIQKITESGIDVGAGSGG